jgi:hypothetical protein
VRTRAGAVLAMLLTASCGGVTGDVDRIDQPKFEAVQPVVDDGRSPFPNVPLVPLNDLVCSPEKYDGQQIRVQGLALVAPRDNNLHHELFPKRIGPCGRLMIGMDYPPEFLKFTDSYHRRRMEFVGTFSRDLCKLDKYRYARTADPDKPGQFVCKTVEMRSDAFLTGITGWRLMP